MWLCTQRYPNIEFCVKSLLMFLVVLSNELRMKEIPFTHKTILWPQTFVIWLLIVKMGMHPIFGCILQLLQGMKLQNAWDKLHWYIFHERESTVICKCDQYTWLDPPLTLHTNGTRTFIQKFSWVSLPLREAKLQGTKGVLKSKAIRHVASLLQLNQKFTF